MVGLGHHDLQSHQDVREGKRSFPGVGGWGEGEEIGNRQSKIIATKGGFFQNESLNLSLSQKPVTESLEHGLNLVL